MDASPGRLLAPGNEENNKTNNDKNNNVSASNGPGLPPMQFSAGRPSSHQQTVIVATAFAVVLVVAVAVTIGIVVVRRRLHQRRIREQKRKIAAVRAVSRVQWGAGTATTGSEDGV